MSRNRKIFWFAVIMVVAVIEGINSLPRKTPQAPPAPVIPDVLVTDPYAEFGKPIEEPPEEPGKPWTRHYKKPVTITPENQYYIAVKSLTVVKPGAKVQGWKQANGGFCFLYTQTGVPNANWAFVTAHHLVTTDMNRAIELCDFPKEAK